VKIKELFVLNLKKRIAGLYRLIGMLLVSNCFTRIWNLIASLNHPFAGKWQIRGEAGCKSGRDRVPAVLGVNGTLMLMKVF
jgi:hypothetical protein